MNPLPPSPSPLRPKRSIKRRRYTQHQLDLACSLSREVSVQYASEQTGVPTNFIYKNLRPSAQMRSTERAWRHKAKKPSAIEAMMASPLYKKAKALAEMWYANVGNGHITMRNCLERAADQCGLEKKAFVRAYRKEKFTTQ